MEAGKEIGVKELQEIVWSFSSNIPPRIVIEAGIKENINNKFYQQAVIDPVSNLKQKWTIFEVLYSLYEFHLSEL
jgi:hypothetical protein